jgi:hypothetical protein
MRCHAVKQLLKKVTFKQMEFLGFFRPGVILCGLLITFSLIPCVYAQRLATVTAETEVYSRPDIDSNVVHTLVFGDQIRVSAKEESGFRRIQYTVGNKARRGYILLEDVGSLQNVKKLPKGYVNPAVKNANLKRSGAYFTGIYSYQYQGKRELQTTADSIYEVSEFTGSTLFFGLGYEYQYDPSWALRAGVVMREVDMQGDALPKGGAGAGNRFQLLESFVGAEVGLRFSPASWGRWSFLAAFEYSSGTAIELKVLSGPPILQNELEKPVLGLLYGAIAYRYGLGSRWTFEPAIRGGAVVTTDPVTILVEASGSAIYHF